MKKVHESTSIKTLRLLINNGGVSNYGNKYNVDELKEELAKKLKNKEEKDKKIQDRMRLKTVYNRYLNNKNIYKYKG